MKTMIYKALKIGMICSSLCAAFAAGVYLGRYHIRQQSVPGALQMAEELCMKELQENGDFKQVHLNICSAYIRSLAEMRLDWLALEIENSGNYESFEKEYLQWQNDFQKAREKVLNEPGEFAGGSMAPLERNLNLSAFFQNKIKEVEKFKKK